MNKPKKTFKNYSTTKSSSTTIHEIEEMLVQHGAREIQKRYNEQKDTIDIEFIAETEHGPIKFRLPVSVEQIQDALALLKSEGFLPSLSKGQLRDREVALRIGWRVMKDWLEVTFTLMKLHNRTLLESFFQHAIEQRSDKTVFELINADSVKPLLLLEGGNYEEK